MKFVLSAMTSAATCLLAARSWPDLDSWGQSPRLSSCPRTRYQLWWRFRLTQQRHRLWCPVVTSCAASFVQTFQSVSSAFEFDPQPRSWLAWETSARQCHHNHWQCKNNIYSNFLQRKNHHCNTPQGLDNYWRMWFFLWRLQYGSTLSMYMIVHVHVRTCLCTCTYMHHSLSGKKGVFWLPS